MTTLTQEAPLTGPEISSISTKKVASRIKKLFPFGCTRILLVNIPQVAEEDFDLATARLGRNTCPQPYGLGLLSRSLKDAGYTTKLIDLNYEILSRVSEANFRYEIWEDRLREVIESFDPHMIGVTCMFSMAHTPFKKVVEYCKTNYLHIAVIAGGVHVTNNAKLVLKELPRLDLIIRHEADNAIVYFANYANGKGDENQLTQIAMLDDGEYIQLEKRDVPNEKKLGSSPDYDDLPIGKFSAAGRIGGYFWLRPEAPMATALFTRGCRAACSFCSVRNFNGVGTRSREIIVVADEIERMRDRYGIEHFMWLDDDLFRPQAVDLFNEIARRNLGITWDASNGVIASASSPEMIEAAAASGCIGLTFGIESGDPDILRAVHKPSKVKHFQAVGELMKKHPTIFSKAYLMIGFPEETVAQIQKTIDLALEIELDWYTTTIVSYLANTEMTRKLIAAGKMSEEGVLYARYASSTGGTLVKKARAEKDVSSFSLDILDLSDPTRVPLENELPDIWFLMDYRINYQRLIHESSPVKLRMKALYLRDLCDRVPSHVALASLFLGIVNRKLGNHSEAKGNFEETAGYCEKSEFWRVRFKKLGLNQLLEEGLMVA